MDAKYVVTASGDAAIFSKYLGMEHREIAGMMDAFAEDGTIVGAGFCSMVGDQLLTYGRSISTGAAARPEDAALLTSMLHSEKLTLVFLEQKLGYIATSTPERFEGRVNPCTIAALEGSRIFK